MIQTPHSTSNHPVLPNNESSDLQMVVVMGPNPAGVRDPTTDVSLRSTASHRRSRCTGIQYSIFSGHIHGLQEPCLRCLSIQGTDDRWVRSTTSSSHSRCYVTLVDSCCAMRYLRWVDILLFHFTSVHTNGEGSKTPSAPVYVISRL